MPRFLLLCALSLLLAGCASRYDVTLFNGTTIRAKGKPQLDKESRVYTFTDLSGQEMRMSAGRIRLIQPARRGSEPDTFDAFQDFKKR